VIAQGFPLAFRVASFALCLIACSCSRQEPLPVTPVPAQKPGTNVADGFFHSLTRFLIVFGADGFAPYSAPANPVRFTAIYYSAHWCPPCRAFTPKLVEWYKGFKSKHANFELVFASSDKDEAAMLDYMKETGMPWPAVKFGEKKAVGLDKYAAGGIPYLVLIDENGKDLPGKEGNDWQPPTEVLKKIEELVK
jgi:thiol-disulfide isomerase/thioredoxin